MDRLLTKKELADRWQVSETCIDNYRRDGILTQCKGIPAVRFSLQHIQELEGVKPERFSPLEKKKLEQELEKVTKERDKYKEIATNVFNESSKVFNFSKGGTNY